VQIIEVTTKSGLCKTNVPGIWAKIENYITQSKHWKKLLNQLEFEELLRDFNFNTAQQKDVHAIQQFLTDIGSIITFNDSSLSDVIVLDPQWLADAMVSTLCAQRTQITAG
jgi:hypothetical protein